MKNKRNLKKVKIITGTALFAAAVLLVPDFAIPENNDEIIFQTGIYKKYNYYLSKNKDVTWIVN